MSNLQGSGISIEVPTGWEGHVYTRSPFLERNAPTGAAVTPSERTFAVLHVASFPLPPATGDYGGGAVELMSNRDLLVVLLEHGPEAAGTALFSSTSIPRIRPDDVSPTQLQRLIEGQGGVQRFFTVAGRAFCLYVVFGSYARRVRTVPVVNDLLGSLTIS